MGMTSSLKKCMVFVPVIMILTLCGSATASADNTGWKTLETKHALIRYQSVKDLAKFNKEIEYGEDKSSALLSLFGLGEDKVIRSVTGKVDAIYERTQDILDMHRKMKKVVINIYPDKEELNRAYTSIYNEECRIRAWYIFDENTVYINADDLHEGMLAHEIAHSVIDHFLLMSPPAASAEILARYVDANLHNSAIVGSLKKSPHSVSSFSE